MTEYDAFRSNVNAKSFSIVSPKANVSELPSLMMAGGCVLEHISAIFGAVVDDPS